MSSGCPGVSICRGASAALAVAVVVCGSAITTAAHADWNNAGGNAGRNGLTSAIGPTSAAECWSGGAASIIAWQPVIEGNRMFVVRQTGFPPGGEPNGSPIHAYDIVTGATLWPPINIPLNTGDWTTWIAGVNNVPRATARPTSTTPASSTWMTIAVILGWGACPNCSKCPPDTNVSCTVDVDDLIAVILAWGACP